MKNALKKIAEFIKEHKVVAVGVALILVVAIIITTIMIANLGKPKSQDKFIGGPTIGPSEESQKKDLEQPQNKVLASLPECGNTKELFTIFPVKEGDYTSIIPLGNLNPSGHTFPTDHLYVEVHDPQKPAAVIKTSGRKALIAPADMWIFGIQSSEQVGGITDYGIDFSPCRDVKGKFGHVGTISPKIKAEIDKTQGKCNEYETGGNKYRNCEYSDIKIQVKAGEEIGTSGSERSGMLDIWMSDYREPQVKRANQSRWSSDRNYVSCFLDYYPAPQKDKYYGTLRGPGGGKRTKEPRCGTVDVDTAGTAQGVWFYNLQGQVQHEDPHLALVYDNIETDKQRFSVGTSAEKVGISSSVYSFVSKTVGKVNRDFSQVSADSAVYCYDTISNNRGGNMSILLTMPNAETLRISKLPGSCGIGPWTMGEYVEFAR